MGPVRPDGLPRDRRHGTNVKRETTESKSVLHVFQRNLESLTR